MYKAAFGLSNDVGQRLTWQSLTASSARLLRAGSVDEERGGEVEVKSKGSERGF